MNLLILGRGKTGSLVAEVAHSRRHHVRVLFAAENAGASALTPDSLAATDVVIAFTTPAAVRGKLGACLHAKQNFLVGNNRCVHPRLARRALVVAAQTDLLHRSTRSTLVS